MPDILDTLCHGQYFSTLDLASGFPQEMANDDFPFGLKNAVVTFLYEKI